MKFRLGARRKCATAIAAAIMFGLPSPALAQPQTYRFDIPAGDLAGALTRFARITRRQLVFDGAAARQARSAGVRGAMSAEAALARLLGGTGFSFRTGTAGVLIVERAARDAAALAQADAGEAGNSEIIVTGTNIRGVTPRSSPLTVIDRREMDARGAATAEQVINSLTQNFNSVNANGLAATRSGYFNINALNGVDLRGLGSGTTLVLLNGRRLSGSSNGRVVDVSLIPLSAVERVDVLTDSASSIYGSDAVGGVVNFVLRDHFRGLEATSAYGGADGQDEYRASLTGGLNWSTGNLVASASYFDRGALTTDERDFSSDVAGLYNLIPPEQRYGLFLSGRQDIGDRLTLNATGLYSRRSGTFNQYRDLGVLAGLGPYTTQSAYSFSSESWFGSLGGTYRVSDALIIDLTGSYSRLSDLSDDYETSTIRGPRTIGYRSRSQTYDATAGASGRLAALPGGDLSYSIGAGTTRETVASIHSYILESLGGGAPTIGADMYDRHRSTFYAYGELHLPLVGPGNAANGVHRLEIDASARYSHYSDFGGNLSPKIGILWAPTEGFNLRGSYGKTFRAPYLSDIGQIGVYQILNVVDYGYPDPTHGTAGTPIGLYIDDGVDSDLGPETSNLLALGLDLRPPSVPNLSLSFTYVSIDYTNRIARGDPGRGTGYIVQPDLYGDLYNFAPTRDDIAAILASSTFNGGDNVTGFDQTDLDALAANVDYILDNRLRNIAQSRQQAVDVSATYGFSRGPIAFTLGANATYILKSDARTTPDSPLLTQIDILGRPVDFRANAYVGLATGGFSGRLTGKYVGPYANPYTPASPRIGDWLTFDLTASYDFGARPGLLSGTSILLSVRNLLDTDPPYVADIGAGVTDGLSEPIGYDPANANPLGRYVALELRKRF